MHPCANGLGRALDRGPELGFAHGPEADLTVLDGSPKRVMVLDVRVEVGAHAQNKGTGCALGRLKEKIHEQLCITSPASILFSLDFPWLSLRVEFFPLVDIEQQACAAPLCLQATTDELCNGHLAFSQEGRIG